MLPTIRMPHTFFLFDNKVVMMLEAFHRNHKSLDTLWNIRGKKLLEFLNKVP